MPHPQSPVKLRLRGGLGNQLFGMAVGWVVASAINKPLLLDGRFIPWEGSNPDRELELNQFDWNGSVSVNFRKTIKFGAKINFIKLMVLKLREVLIPKPMLLSANVGESISDLGALANRAIEGKTLQGYFQDIRWVEKAFECGMPKQLALSSATNEATKLHGQIGESIAIHIRLGDFLDFPDSFPIPGEKYYLRSLDFFRLIDGNQKVDYWIFTDDSLEAQSRFPQLFAGATRILSQDDFSGPESLFLMSEFTKIVTSNSSFSTWAGLFSSSRGGRVTCPELPAGQNIDLRPVNWTRVGELT